MSRRRGAPSRDADAIERRQWYADMQNLAFKGAEVDNEPPEDVTVSVLTNKSAIDDRSWDASTVETGEKSEPTTQPSMMTFKTFNSLSVEMFDDSVAAAKARSEIPKSPKIIYVKPENFIATKWITRLLQRKDRSAPDCVLLCFHGLGGNPMLFRHWAKRFDSNRVDVYGVCFPGRMNRVTEPFFENVVELSGCVVDALLELDILNPATVPRVVFFGHSIGAIVAFEVAKSLKKFGISISHLIVSAARSPDVLSSFNSDRFGTKYFCASEEELLDRMRKLGGIHPMISGRRDMQKQFLNILRADYKVYEKYLLDDLDEEETKGDAKAQDHRLSCSLTTFGVEDDVGTNPYHIDEWRNHTTGYVTSCRFRKGGHCYLQTNQDNEAAVLAVLQQICAGDDQPEFVHPPGGEDDF